ncbi:HTH-type transcriptional activator ArnR [Sulfolobus acidocaldarius]|nr:HTH-type transcriptional activator ArnR [Sulfolobus acidocaldarius]AGE71107.1 hypothetical protein SacN8_05710 [Sulfolobus acidocaldarius N8]AGE73378.1 hypothetical protein SacRon12I_05700 [Sulfolobus acidocaldarius Ron12/I]ALU31332.1 MarR family transcriptional regulator [Sulfolobus acidocaldarius]WCM35044.1 MarR family transcriptional regulator [Sulfolobus acidocaldarius DSM 639]
MNKRVFDILRELDSLVDFSRAKLQWDILIILATKGPSSTTEISQTINTSRKSIIDAIRKLVDKELVTKVKGDIYGLSEKGEKLLESFDSIMSINVTDKPDSSIESNSISLTNIAEYFYMLEILKMALLNKQITIDKASHELGISKQTLKYYIETFTENKLLKVVNQESVLGKSKKIYVLTDESRKLVSRLPELTRLKRNLPLKILLKLTGSYRYEIALTKVMLFNVISIPVLMYLKDQLGILEAIWLYVIILLPLLSIFAEIFNRI